MANPSKRFAASLNLPVTRFPLRANAPVREPALLPSVTTQLYARQAIGPLTRVSAAAAAIADNHAAPQGDSVAVNAAVNAAEQTEATAPIGGTDTRKVFVLHDGPPFANGRLHIGHAFNKVLKDIVNRYRLLRGDRIDFVPGWDCHGLPIELKALQAGQEGYAKAQPPGSKAKLTKKERKALKKASKARAKAAEEGTDTAAHGPVEVRRLASSFAREAIAEQMEQSKRWAVMGDYDAAYRTFDPSYEAAQIGAFGEMYAKGLIYRGLKPVYWSPSSETALAEAELEYNDAHVSPAVFVAMPILSAAALSGDDDGGVPVEAVIWTTTPWTLPANRAICVGPNIVYSVVRLDGAGGNVAGTRRFLVASARIEALSEAIGAPLVVEQHIVHGSTLDGAIYRHPLTGDCHPVLVGDHVTDDSGSGLVHTAPGHGMDDFVVCRAAGIDVFCPVDAQGRFTAEAGSDYAGLSVLDGGSERVIEDLAAGGALLSREDHVHKYPYDWRTKQPIVLRATDQWFMTLRDIKPDLLRAIEGVEIVPDTGRSRLRAMVEARDDWCISRQRVWGVPIPAFFHVATGEPLVTPESVAHIQGLVQSHGSDCWWDLPESELLPPGYDGSEWVRGSDTMDVWFDSGCSWAAVLRARGMPFPADLYLEGSDQHRGWFQSSLITAMAVEGRAPYKTVLTNGFVLDRKGVKMSKSLGNVISAEDIINGGNAQVTQAPLGADILRLWVASQQYASDVRLGPQVLGMTVEAYRRVRNCTRFLLGNLDGFDVATDGLAYEDLLATDKYMLHLLADFGGSMTESYDTYRFHRGFATLSNFIVNDLSAFYFDAIKDRLYAEAPRDMRRRSAQTALAAALDVVTTSVAPVLCFLAEDVHQHRPGSCAVFSETDGTLVEADGSTFDQGWFDRRLAGWLNPETAETFGIVRSIREAVNKEIEPLRESKEVGSNVGAAVRLGVQRGSRAEAALAALTPSELADAFAVSVADVEVVADSRSDFGGGLGDGSLAEVCDDRNEPPVWVAATKAPGSKCERCWKWSPACSDSVCPRCRGVLHAIGWEEGGE